MKMLTFLLCFTMFSSYAYEKEDAGSEFNYALDSVPDDSGDDYVTINIKVVDEQGKEISEPHILWYYDDSAPYNELIADKQGGLVLKTLPGLLTIDASKSSYDYASIDNLILDENMNYTLEMTLLVAKEVIAEDFFIKKLSENEIIAVTKNFYGQGSICKIDSVQDMSGDDYVTINIKVLDEYGGKISEPRIFWHYNDVGTYTKIVGDKKGLLTLKILPGYITILASKSSYANSPSYALMLNKDMTYTFDFRLGQIIEVQTFKPVIYLYPERTMPFVLSVKNQGNFEFIYPGGQAVWEGIAHPDGGLEIDGGEYDYLFWDGKQKQSDFDNYVNVGSVVGKHDVVEFLETSLTTLALDSREQQDFISFWAPKMIQHDNVQVTFLVNNDYDVVSKNTISPTPDTEIRVFMLFKPVLPGLELTPQQLPILERTGFTVVEWGGAEMMNFEMP